MPWSSRSRPCIWYSARGSWRHHHPRRPSILRSGGCSSLKNALPAKRNRPGTLQRKRRRPCSTPKKRGWDTLLEDESGFAPENGPRSSRELRPESRESREPRAERMPRTCGVCWETYHLSWNTRRMDCCGQVICWKCLRGHIVAVMDSISEGRDMCCPFCLKDRLPDALVRTAFRKPRWFLWENRDLKRYETWSVEFALVATGEEILRCPGLDCGNLWLVDRDRMAAKRQREPRWLWNPARAFYSAPLINNADARRVYCNACRKAFCSICRRPWRQITKGHRGQAMGIFATDPRLAAPSESHDLRSCIAFAGRSLDLDDDFAAVAAAANARHCPNCSLRVARSAGCNHIQCPACATHWCFVCEAPWSNAHYACRDEFGANYAGPLPGGGPVVVGPGPGPGPGPGGGGPNNCILM